MGSALNNYYNKTYFTQKTDSCAIFTALHMLLGSSIPRRMIIEKFKNMKTNTTFDTLIQTYINKTPHIRPRTANFAPNIGIKKYNPIFGYRILPILRRLITKFHLDNELFIDKPSPNNTLVSIAFYIYNIKFMISHALCGVKNGNRYYLIDSEGGKFNYDWSNKTSAQILKFLQESDPYYNKFKNSYMAFKLYAKN
jgi:hypothetical protein